LGKPPERTLNSDFFQGRNINTSGSTIIDNKHSNVKTGACSYNIDPSINKPILIRSKSRNSIGITAIDKAKIALYAKQAARNTILTRESDPLAISDKVFILITRLTMPITNTITYV
jgi:hypothetical protein